MRVFVGRGVDSFKKIVRCPITFWLLCERSGWPDNQSYLNILSWCWVKDEERYLIIINFSDTNSRARVHVPWDELRGRTWRLSDALSNETYDRDGNDMRDSGLHVDMGPWGFHFFYLNPL